MTRIYLDVDGVLNAFGRGDPDPEVWDDYRTVRVDAGHGRTFPITYSPTVVDAVWEWQESGADVRWLTTWGHWANADLSTKLGLPNLIVSGEPPFREKQWWKYEIVRGAHEASPVSFVWIDDDLGGQADDGASEWVQSLNGQGLGIRPDSRKGLTRRLLGEVNEFLAANAVLQ